MRALRRAVKRFALCYWTVVCLSYLSVTLVYCGQTVRWIKIKLGKEVSLGPGHIVSDGDPASLPKGAQPPQIFCSCLLWRNGWMVQDATWYEGRLRPRPHCVRWGPSSYKQGGTAPNFRPMSIVAKRLPISAASEHLLSC